MDNDFCPSDQSLLVVTLAVFQIPGSLQLFQNAPDLCGAGVALPHQMIYADIPTVRFAQQVSKQAACFPGQSLIIQQLVVNNSPTVTPGVS